MKTKLKGILTLLLAFVVQVTFAQEKTVSGTVSDDSGPLPGVSILIKGTASGTETDFDGKYTIKTKVGDILVFQYLGYKKEESTVGTSNTINVTLSEDSSTLDEVIVVAYGTTTKEAFTGSASVVTAKELEGRTITSPLAAIEGRATGVQFTTGNAGPGASPNIVIRGVSTLQGSSNPLIVVDGIQFDGPLNTINQEDIASFTVLKDAASTSIYGSRAANGVVLITTKRGKKGDIKVNFSSQVGAVTNSIPFYDEVTPGQYYETMWEALKNSSAGGGDPQFATDNIYNRLGYNPFNVPNGEIVGTDGKLNPNAEVIYDSLDWYDLLARTGLRTNYNVNVSAGGEKHSVFFSASYLDEESAIIKSGFDRLTTRLNADFEVNDWLKIGGSANLAITEITQPTAADTGNIANPFGFAKNIGSIYPVYVNDLDGNIVLDAAGNPVFDAGEGNAAFNIGSRPISQGRHALQELLLNDERDQDNTYGFRAYADINLLDGLSFRVNYGRDINDLVEREYENAIIGDAQPTGRFSQTHARRQFETFNQLLNYNKTFNEVHNFEATLGHESNNRTFGSFDAQATEQVAEGIFEFDNFSSPTNIGGSTTTYRLESYFLRALYNYDSKYYLSASARRDGSSVFSTDARWGTFYSVGASWRIDQEEFMEDVSFVNSLKLRASYGEVGNDALPNPRDFFLSQARYSLTSNAAAPGIWWSDLGNTDLQWESLENYDIALEFALFDNFLDGSIEYYRRNSSGLLFELPIGLSNGFDAFNTNLGDLFNDGIEIGLTAHLFKQKDFNWDLTLQASTFRNEITKIDAPSINGSKRFAEGVSQFDFYILHSAGVDPDNGDALFFMYEFDENGESIPVLDADGNHEITNDWEETERAYVGESTVPDLNGSILNSFSYKGLALEVLVTYQIGGSVLDNGYSAMMHEGDFGSSLHPDILKAWRQPGDITDVPRLENGNNDLVLTQSSRFLTDASFVSLKNVNLSYTFDSNLTQKIGVDNLRLSLTGENLFIQTARSGLNPQFSLAGTDNANGFNPARIVSLGLNVSF
jgi:TonB-linked SusC/RagA family outer membrane protein